MPVTTWGRRVSESSSCVTAFTHLPNRKVLKQVFSAIPQAGWQIFSCLVARAKSRKFYKHMLKNLAPTVKNNAV